MSKPTVQPPQLTLVRVLGDNPATGDPYWLGSDGNVWYGRWISRAVNQGTEAEFMELLAKGMYRFKKASD